MAVPSERWRRISELFDGAAGQPAEHRGAWLAAACQGDAELLREVESLLAEPASEATMGLAQAAGVADLLELVDGDTLAERISRTGRGLPVTQALEIARQIADALDAAHGKAIIHRDLKPANVKINWLEDVQHVSRVPR